MVYDVTNYIGYKDAYQPEPGKSELGKEDFLRLMTEQLKYQDPMNPMDSSAFTAQLAQFSSLEQLTNMSGMLEQSVNANYMLIQSVNNTMSANLIGMEVKVGNENITYNGQESVNLGYTLPAESSDVTIKIYDESGNLVRTVDDLGKTKGTHKFTWDFTDDNGNNLAMGKYSFKVEAKAMNGVDDLSVEAYQVGIIESIKFGANGAVLTVNGVEVALADILEILQPSEDGKTDKYLNKELTNLQNILNGGISG